MCVSPLLPSDLWLNDTSLDSPFWLHSINISSFPDTFHPLSALVLLRPISHTWNLFICRSVIDRKFSFLIIYNCMFFKYIMKSFTCFFLIFWFFCPIRKSAFRILLYNKNSSKWTWEPPDVAIWLMNYIIYLSLLNHLPAAAAAKSLQSCLTLCYPIDGSPPGSAVPGTLQARTL